MTLLQDTLALARQVKDAGSVPVVVFDLDATLFDNGPRTWAILDEFAAQSGHTQLREKLAQLPKTGLPYLIKDTLALLGVTDEATIAAAQDAWFKRFFTDAYQAHDVPMAGAQAFARELYKAGATLVYLSGRDAPNMLVGCAESLRQHGFPVGLAHTLIVLKPDFESEDLAFKEDAVDFIAGLGEPVLAVDNEPGNCNLFLRAWPKAIVGLIETQHAPNPPALDDGVIRFADFLS